jgi:hypothetical protein
MGPARIYPWRRMHRSRAPSIARAHSLSTTLGGLHHQYARI